MNGDGLERSSHFQRELGAALRNDALHLILLPTEQCNFRCTYCYEDFKIGRMATGTVQGVKRLLDRRMGELERLNVSWFGGEPLLAKSVVEEISTHVVASVEKVGMQYLGDMTTNGYLLDLSTAERLSELGIRTFQVSLDGPMCEHDRTRIRANGKGSFGRIWENLLSLRSCTLPVRVLLRVHLTPKNLSFMPEFLSRVRDTFLGDSRFSVQLKPVERMGGPNDDDLDVLSREDRKEGIEHLETLVRGTSPASDPPVEQKVCYAARPNSLVIRADGSIAKCTVALSDPANVVGRLRSDGTLQISNDRLSPWLRGWVNRDLAAIGCPYIGMSQSEPQLLQISPGPL
jgi:uncharacterized protein